MLRDCFFGALGLRPPLDGTGPRDDGKIAVHHDGVLDEHAVGTAGRGRYLRHLPAGVDKGADIALPLLHRDVGVDGRAPDVGEQPIRKARAGPTYQSRLGVHGPIVRSGSAIHLTLQCMVSV